MRLLVTGGAGFIGSNFVHRSLAQHDCTITVLDIMGYAANPQSLAGLADNYPSRFDLVVGDICDKPLVDKLVAEHDVVVHFAAESHNDQSLRDPLRFATTNVLGTIGVCEAAVRHSKRLHHISTDEVFGDLAFDDPHKFTPDTCYRPSSPYSASKASADHFVRAYIRSFGLAATISNCSNNYGPRQHPEKFIPRQITALLSGQQPRLYGSGQHVRDWIHVDDHNDAVWKIIESGQLGETYLIGADGEHTNAQVIAYLLEIVGADPHDYVHVTDRAGHDRRYAIDASSTLALGWEPQHRDFRAGLAETVAWYRENPQWWANSRQQAEAFYQQSETITGNGGDATGS
ncbi:dTDP-glucose 4,6-dehydratase [Corynebacterium choanae]|uniref:dTDP-glucose 4,6-dehydratase n=1 Tax=Corynebacterium choanae TaxID=1862358 RepID=A0A3G6J8M6_9CORY|nr:dTDP-glucose 4,6-dehydratase [Corynebacterium choanae]AZA14465.1 dTDP-glucose 4,6-dehydratase [Corynebacterium choanae]